MTLTIAQWHQRYQQQAKWTKQIREYIFNRIGIKSANLILDVGCGTGVLEKEFESFTSSDTYGIDIDTNRINYAQSYAPRSNYVVGNGLYLPYPSEVFDITLCHFLLLWVDNALNAVQEMARVTRSRGFVLTLAEPDYGGRIDYPKELELLGDWQTEALKDQGVNPYIGRELRAMFSQAGLVNIEVGILGGQWIGPESEHNIELEWQVVESDLCHNQIFMQQADRLKEIEIMARVTGKRILYVPTFYALGMVGG